MPIKSELITEEIKQEILKAQKNEITEYFIYQQLAAAEKNPANKEILDRIAKDELDHYNFWKERSQQEVSPSKWTIWKYRLIAKIFGITFSIKLMERGEEAAQKVYDKFSTEVPDVCKIIADEEEHENALIQLIEEERLNYVGSMVLGLNDALVELTGALAGLTFALQDTRLIAVTGLITGIAAALSMAASEYLSTKSEINSKRPGKAALYTGTAYTLTVILLIAPYFLVENYYHSLAFTLLNAILVIFIFNYYISVAKELNFRKRFIEMTLISLGIAALTFGIGVVVRIFLGV